MLAAIDGSREIGFAVIATTLVLMAVFLPISFIPGNIGRLFGEFGITIAAAVGILGAGRADAGADDELEAVCQRHRARQVAHAVDRFFQALSSATNAACAALAAPRHVVGDRGALAFGLVLVAVHAMLPPETRPPEDRHASSSA